MSGPGLGMCNDSQRGGERDCTRSNEQRTVPSLLGYVRIFNLIRVQPERHYSWSKTGVCFMCLIMVWAFCLERHGCWEQQGVLLKLPRLGLDTACSQQWSHHDVPHGATVSRHVKLSEAVLMCTTLKVTSRMSVHMM